MKINRFNESFNEITPKVGDYVICKELDIILDIDDMTPTYDFTSTHIGRCIQDDSFNSDGIKKIITYPYHIKYENIPTSISDNFKYGTRTMCSDEILYCSDNKDELELKLNANKFNI